MSSPTYAYTSINTIVARTKKRLKIEHLNTEDMFLRDCVIEAAKEMSTKQDLIYYFDVELEIDDNFCVCLPSNFLVLGTDNPCYSPLSIKRECRCHGECCCNFGTLCYEIQDGYIRFPNDIGAHKCTISYTGVNLWEDGTVKIPQNNSRAIMNYAMGEWRKAEEKPAVLWMENMRIWTQGKLAARGASKLLTPQSRARLYYIMNRPI